MRSIPERYLLYAEDDPDDQELLTDMVRSIAPDVTVITCPQGLELMQFLGKLQPGDNYPCCIILDMNMPLWDGIRTLGELKKSRGLSHLPVVMFTTSTSEKDAARAKELGAEAFLSKPVREPDFKDVAARFTLFCTLASSKKVDADNMAMQ